MSLAPRPRFKPTILYQIFRVGQIAIQILPGNPGKERIRSETSCAAYWPKNWLLHTTPHKKSILLGEPIDTFWPLEGHIHLRKVLSRICRESPPYDNRPSESPSTDPIYPGHKIDPRPLRMVLRYGFNYPDNWDSFD